MRHRPNIPRVADEYHAAIHLAKLRLDGFVSLRAGPEGGLVDTRPVTLEGGHLLINAVATGEIRAEITSRDGRQALPGWGAEDCEPVTGDQLHAELRWRGRHLAELKGQQVRIRFHVKAGELYSFWLEP